MTVTIPVLTLFWAMSVAVGMAFIWHQMAEAARVSTNMTMKEDEILHTHT